MEVAAPTRPCTPSTPCSPPFVHHRPPWHGRGQGFESPKLHYLNIALTRSFVLSIGDQNGVGPRLQAWRWARRDARVGRILERYASAAGQERLFGFQAGAAVVGYLVLAVGAGGAFDLLELRR